MYLDDVIIFSNTFDEHVGHVREVLSVLQEAGLSLKLNKCTFFSSKVDYLGHVIRPGKLAVEEKNTDAVKKFLFPASQTEMRSFLGMCNVYRRFIPKFARMAAPLNQILKKGHPVALPPPTEEQQESFSLLKNALVSPPILRIQRPDLPYSVETDACKDQVGCALFQSHEDRTRHPIGFWSRTLNAAERNYSASERECLGVIWTIQTLRSYLERRHFTLYTDHQALKWMMDLTDVSGRIARWRLRLLEFDLEVKYKKGADNMIADAISRLSTWGYTRDEPDLDIPCLLVDSIAQIFLKRSVQVDKDSWSIADWENDNMEVKPHEDISAPPLDSALTFNTQVSLITLEEIRESQERDKACHLIREQITNNRPSSYVEDDRGLITRVAPLDKTVQILVPESLRQRVLFLSHHTPVAGHPGITKQFYTLRRTFY